MTSACSRAPEPLVGLWRAHLESPGGELLFGLELSRQEAGWSAWLVNGEERIPVPRVEVGDGRLVLGMDHYDSTLSASIAADGRGLAGEWLKRRGPDTWTRMAFAAEPGPAFACPGEGTTPVVEQRYRVVFESDSQPAVGLLRSDGDGCVRGTFLTTTGDYRYLAGHRAPAPADDPDSEATVTLSCFDGAHAFLFEQRIARSGELAGDFWSGEAWHETYTGSPDAQASLPDGFALTRSEPGVDLAALRFPDLDGVTRSLADPRFAGKARILQLFGSWCPNCHDASELMAELQREYGPAGLSIVGLAFELTGDHERDAAQVRRYAERHGVTYPLLIAGLADKAAASEALPLLDRVRSYPTTVFLGADGAVRAVYQGFSGPATGAAHEALRAAFIGIVEELLAGD